MIIKSLLDCDLYKFFMWQVIYHRYTSVPAEYEYKLRNLDVSVFDDDEFLKQFHLELEHLCDLRFKKEELEMLESSGYFRLDFLEYLKIFQLQMSNIKLKSKPFELAFRGSWVSVMMFEIYIMEIISELYFSFRNVNIETGRSNLMDKIKLVKDFNNQLGGTYQFKFADFGGRRRVSRKWHEEVLDTLLKEIPHNIAGTSNVMFAKHFGIKPIGTQAHEYFMGFQGLVKESDSQKEALQVWADEYRGSLGIALTDTITMDCFLNDFDLYFAKLFDGARHDSGDPYIWCDKLIDHYQKLGIDPRSKTAVFSDGLNIPKSIKLFNTYKNDIKLSFGIGTNLTNDVGFAPLNHVIKMVKCNGQHVCKISDSDGKTMCRSEDYVNYLKSVFGVDK